MNRQFTFENQNFQPDYIAFKFQRLDPFEEKQILDYLFKVGFNIYSELPPKHHSVRNHSKNRFKIYITKDIPFWQGTVIHFTGENGNYFYTLLKQKSIEWIFFNEATLARFDLCYLRKNKKTDKIPSSEFFIACFDKIRRTYRNVILEKNNAGLIEKVGRRKSYRCFRIYEKQENKIKFEYELKGTASEEYHSLLVSNRFEDLEHKLSLEFLEKFGKLLPLNYPYMDWLLVQLRPLRKQEVTERSVKTDYITIMDPNLLTHHKHFCNLLQFLTYVQDLEYQVGDLGSTSYRQVKFRVRDFLKYTKESQNYYQLKELLQFFDLLQKNSLIKFFSDSEYRSLITIPEVKLQKSKQNSWIAKVWIAEELFYYTHPFLYPDLFQQKLTKYELAVYSHVIQVFSSVNLEKVFSMKDFLQNYPSRLSNSDKTKIKNHFISVLQKFREHGLIEDKYKVIQEGILIDTEKLTSSNIKQGFVVYEKLHF